MARTDAARAVAMDQGTLRVTSVLFGARVHDGEIIRIESNICRPIVAGVEYFVSSRCSSSECHWYWYEVERAKGFEDYVRNRHVVTRSEVMMRLRAWQKHKLSTEELERWLSTADERDSKDETGDSLARAVIERIEDLLEFVGQAQACDPSDATWLREQGSQLFLDRFARLPKQETQVAYEAWLDAHEDAEDEWDAEELQSDLELALERARSWDHSIACFLKGRPEGSR